MDTVRAKKFLGQHFLTDETIARRIVDSLSARSLPVLEVGPGMGVLTKYLIDRADIEFKVVEIDSESVDYLHRHYPSLQVVEGDFLRMNLTTLFQKPFAVIGNFPYNISSQILFRVYENHELVPELVGMFQKEVAERVAAKPGSKTYGILSVLLAVYYDIQYLFTVPESVFNPPPKVKSAVISLRRKEGVTLPCEEAFFTTVVKTAFNQRRKTLRNALKSLSLSLDTVPDSILASRAEQISFSGFVQLSCTLQGVRDASRSKQ